jgi:hypothetical protein
VVADAVVFEPVSTIEFPANRENLTFGVGEPSLRLEGKLTTGYIAADHFVLYPLPINLPGDRSKR